MKEKADAPTQISEIDLDQPNPNVPGDTNLSDSATLPETRKALEKNDTQNTSPEEVNKPKE